MLKNKKKLMIVSPVYNILYDGVHHLTQNIMLLLFKFILARCNPLVLGGEVEVIEETVQLRSNLCTPLPKLITIFVWFIISHL